MSCRKIILLQLALVALFISCQKEDLEKHDYPHIHTSTAFIDTLSIDVGPIIKPQTIENYELVLFMEKSIRDLTINTIIQCYLYPELHGIINSTATTRTDCPESDLSTTTGATGNVHLIELDYGTGCVPGIGGSSDGDVLYSGIVDVTLNGDLNQSGTTVNIVLGDDFKINGNNDMDGRIQLEYIDIFGQDFYAVTLLDLQNTNLTSSDVTEVLSFSNYLDGGFYIKENTVGDVSNSPLNILNDTIQYEGCFEIHCPNTEKLRSCSIAPIYYNLYCGVPFDGNLALDTLNMDGTYGGNDPNLGTYGNLDFSFPKSISEGVCDSLINFRDDSDGSTTVIHL